MPPGSVLSVSFAASVALCGCGTPVCLSIACASLSDVWASSQARFMPMAKGTAPQAFSYRAPTSSTRARTHPTIISVTI